MAYNIARREGFQDLAEDFAQNYALQSILGTTQNIRQALVDFVRDEMGRTDRSNAKRTFFESSISIDQPRREGGHSLHETIPDERGLLEASGADLLFLMKHYQTKVTRIEHAVLVLAYGWGFSQREIARVFGVNEMSISKYAKRLERAIEMLGSQVKEDEA